jgi:hypothetical protein
MDLPCWRKELLQACTFTHSISRQAGRAKPLRRLKTKSTFTVHIIGTLAQIHAVVMSRCSFFVQC